MDILTTLAATARVRYQDKRDDQIERAAFERRLECPLFARALRNDCLSVIAEVKRASPSKGLIVNDFNPLATAKAYVQAGSQAVSVLTEPTQFLGSDSYLKTISASISLPTLRKDFIVTTYQILESRILGASAVLLIAALLSERTLSHFIKLASQLGLDALVEVHDEAELECALASGATLIGINNRNLRTFSVDLQTSLKLKKLTPDYCTTVSESGITSKDHAKLLRSSGFDAILVGEHLMKSQNLSQTVGELRV